MYEAFIQIQSPWMTKNNERHWAVPSQNDIDICHPSGVENSEQRESFK
jgi:hypothetical protein